MNITTLENNKKRKVKTVEIAYSNMTFIVQAYCHYMKELNNPSWSRITYTAKIKETGEGIGGMGDRTLIKRQMNLINSKPHLFLK
jgi:hypothetical protein